MALRAFIRLVTDYFAGTDRAPSVESAPSMPEHVHWDRRNRRWVGTDHMSNGSER
jgi:hypothetical protein